MCRHEPKRDLLNHRSPVARLSRTDLSAVRRLLLRHALARPSAAAVDPRPGPASDTISAMRLILLNRSTLFLAFVFSACSSTTLPPGGGGGGTSGGSLGGTTVGGNLAGTAGGGNAGGVVGRVDAGGDASGGTSGAGGMILLPGC